MNIAYLDCASGVSGDMMLAALVDAGVDLASIQSAIDSLGLPSCRLTVSEVKKKGFRALNLQVEHQPEHAHRHLHHITDIIDASAMTDSQKDLAKRIFTRLGEAEAKVHGVEIRKVHFHEVGAVDSIADIVGAAVAWDLLAVDRVVCSPIPTGCGEIEIAHGKVSVPAPATAELLYGIPLAPSNVHAELTTPTGAAIIAEVADEFGSLPAMTITTIGYGAGDRDLQEQPNLLRLLVGRSAQDVSQPDSSPLVSDQVIVLETNLDDVSGEIIGYCLETLLGLGALDVYSTPILMKKNRPAVKLTVLCAPKNANELEKVLMRETGTFGVRRWTADRHKAARSVITVNTKWGPIQGKAATWADGTTTFSPEFESCRQAARESSTPLAEVYQAVQQAFSQTQNQTPK